MRARKIGTPRKRAEAATRSLWFNAPETDEEVRRTLIQERVVSEALTLIAQEDVEALTMRTLGARLGVVPGALYRHVRRRSSSRT